jgi:glutathione S-transferase
MQLLYSPASPFARKVRVVAHETGLADRIDFLPVQTTPLRQDPALTRANPVGKLPTLVRDDGPAIFDSRVITRFLDAQAGGRLYPAGRVWEVLTLEALADGLMEAALQIVYEERFRDEASRSRDLVEANRARIERVLDALADRWMSQLQGPLHAGQIGTACALCYLDFRHGALGWRDARDTLSDWYARFAERPSMKATEPDG